MSDIGKYYNDMDGDEFVCLAACDNAFSEIGRESLDIGIHRSFLKVKDSLHEEPGILVFCETGECEGHIADISEHYDLAEIDPVRIFAKKRLVEGLDLIDFSSLCDLFMKEERFQVYEWKEEGAVAWKRNPGRRYGSYGTSVEQYRELIDKWEAKYGEVYPFFQSMVLRDMMPLFLTKDGSEKEALRPVLEKIDDDILCGTDCVEADVRIRILSLKYGEDVEANFVYRGGKLKYHNLSVVPLKEIPFVIEKAELVKGKFNIAGRVLLPLEHSEIEYCFMDNQNKRYELAWEDGENRWFLGEKLMTEKCFLAVFPVGTKTSGMRFMYRYQNMYQSRVRMEFAKEFGIVPDTRMDCCMRDGYLLRVQKRILSFTPLSMKVRLKTRIKLFFTFLGKRIKMV